MPSLLQSIFFIKILVPMNNTLNSAESIDGEEVDTQVKVEHIREKYI